MAILTIFLINPFATLLILASVPIVGVVMAACLATGIVWLIVASFRRARKLTSVILIIIPFYLVGAFALNVTLFFYQRKGNEQRGQILAQAIVRFHAEQGRYPHSQVELWPVYLKRLPTCWYGALPCSFAYGIDRLDNNKPSLYFLKIPMDTVRSYNLDEDRWEDISR